MPETGTAIRIRNLHRSFGHTKVLRGIDLDIPEGRSLVIIGGSGTGKSVLIKCMAGLLQPDSGTLEICGRNIAGHSRKDRAHVTGLSGMLFQGAALFDSLKIWENVAFRLLYAQGMPRRQARRQALQCLAKVGLGPAIGDLMPAVLSGGMQKRVSLARAIATGPDILFFDEPTAGLDPIVSAIINKLIIEQVRALGATAVTITHDLESARKIADDVAMLYEGKIIWHGKPERLTDSDNIMVDQFVHGRADGPIKMATHRER